MTLGPSVNNWTSKWQFFWMNDAFIQRFIEYCCTPKALYNHVGGGGLLNHHQCAASSTFVVNVSEYLTYIRIWLWGIWYFNLWQSQTHYQSKSVFLWLFAHFIVIKSSNLWNNTNGMVHDNSFIFILSIFQLKSLYSS